MSSVDFNLSQMKELLCEVGKYYSDYLECANRYVNGGGRYLLSNFMFEYGDAAVYYGLIRHFRPQKIIEFGIGHSTSIACLAMENYKQVDVVAIDVADSRVLDPKPSKIILKKWRGSPLVDPIAYWGLSEAPAELTSDDYDLVKDLEANDIVFLDGDHSKEEFNHHFLANIWPRLKSGVIIHFHDIWLHKNCSPESVAVLEFIQNYAVEVMLCLYFFGERDLELYQQYIPCGRQNTEEGIGGDTSLYLRKN